MVLKHVQQIDNKKDREYSEELSLENNAKKIGLSIKTKLIAVVIVLVIILMISMAWFLTIQKRNELTHDIYINTVNYAELISDDLIENNKTFLQENGFIQFNRVIQNLFRKTEDISRITIVKFNGDVIYDSKDDKLQQYQGVVRSFKGDNNMLERIQAPFQSIDIIDQNRVLYLEKDQLGARFTVNLNGKKIPEIKFGERINTVVNPVGQKYAVIYKISYQQLDNRIRSAIQQIGLMLLTGIIFGAIIAIMIGVKLSKPIKALTKGVSEIADGNFDHRVEIHSNDELGVLSDAFNIMAVDLKKSRKALVYKERVMKELELAKTIQKSLIPKTIPKIEGLDVSASVNPAEEIGGDCYDFIQVDDVNTILYLGDVTGHGVPSGLLVSVTNAIIYAFSKLNNIYEIIVRTNAILQAKSQPNMFITLAMLSWNSREKSMQYISAGHEKILHYKKETGLITELESGGIALGMLPDCSKLVKQHNIDLKSGDYLILYSDGIPEAWRGTKEQYGMGRMRTAFMHAIQENKDITSEEIRTVIIKDVRRFIGNTKQADDITIMVVKMQ